MNALEIARKLIACPSVTPKDAGAQEFLAGYFENLGFTCHILPFENVPNLFARIGTGTPHFCYAGHADVVPPGPESAWTYGPFNPTVKDGKLIGRGACDMKGSVAAMAAAAGDFLQAHKNFQGSISFLITGDEEGMAVNGTVKVLEWMKQNGHVPDVCLVGEPTNPKQLGDEIKIGRRGSLSGKITVTGRQGHVAYQEAANNPLPRLVKLLSALAAHRFDKGTKFFPPSNLEITSIDVGNTADNVIPASGAARFNVRFNDQWSSETLAEKIRQLLDKAGGQYEFESFSNAESFITPKGAWSELVADTVKEVTGRRPEYSTKGGTSDARFIHSYCPVVEFGLTNTSAHQVDEFLYIDELEKLATIYTRLLEKYFKPD